MLPMKLLDWIDKSKLDLFYLSLNPKRICKLIEDYGEEYIYNTYFDD